MHTASIIRVVEVILVITSCARIHGAVSQKAVIFIFAAVRT
jgi:hypothetical protein